MNDVTEIVNRYRKEGIKVTDADVDHVKFLCRRKMELCKIKDPEYFKALFEDELIHFWTRCMINGITLFGLRRNV